MIRVQPGWLIVLFAAVILISGWLPWLTTTADGGGRVSAIGGGVGARILPPHFGVGQLIVLSASVLIVAGALAARGLSVRLAAVGALVISLVIGGLIVRFYYLNGHSPHHVGYGLYIGAAAAVAAILCAVWALLAAFWSTAEQ